jgi:ubiquinone/menaquinone biosynthesis C-methylase UbiE
MALSKSNRLPNTESQPAVPRRAGIPGRYDLATGEAAAHRLRVLHALYGPGSRRVLLDAGLRKGMRVADLGCGVGMVTGLLAELVGSEGMWSASTPAPRSSLRLVGLAPVGTHGRFVEGSATDTGLPLASFDLVYCRFLLIHLTEPDRVLREMGALLKPNGVLV